MTSNSPEQTQRRDASEYQTSTAYQQRQQQRLPHRRPSTSAARSISSIFPNDPDQAEAIELKQYTRKPPPPQIHEDHDDDHDDDLHEGQTTPDSCSHEDGNTNTGVTTPDLTRFPEPVPRTSFAASSVASVASAASAASSTGNVHSRLSIFWGNNISLVVPSKDARDHLGRQLYSVSSIAPILAHSFFLLDYSLNWTLVLFFSSHFPLLYVVSCLSSPDISSNSTVPLIRRFPWWIRCSK